jgi:hypothetical protein
MSFRAKRTPSLVLAGLAAAVAALLLAHDQNRKATDGFYQGPDVLEWLTANANPHPFASNHFDHILTFVSTLRDAGAEAVLV